MCFLIVLHAQSGNLHNAFNTMKCFDLLFRRFFPSLLGLRNSDTRTIAQLHNSPFKMSLFREDSIQKDNKQLLIFCALSVRVFFLNSNVANVLLAGSLPPSPADSGVSDVDSSSSGHTSTDELKARLQPSGSLGPHSPLGYHHNQQFLTPYHYPTGQQHRSHLSHPQHHYASVRTPSKCKLLSVTSSTFFILW